MPRFVYLKVNRNLNPLMSPLVGSNDLRENFNIVISEVVNHSVSVLYNY